MITGNFSTRIKTIFCDIDGCIFRHFGNSTDVYNGTPKLLSGVFEAFTDWCKKGYTVIIVTARPESLREVTIRQLNEAGLFYAHLIMGLPRGTRVIINDKNDCHDSNTAKSINLLRDGGMSQLGI